jgi:hypothetical protein
MMYTVEKDSDGMINHVHTKFHENLYRHLSNIMLILLYEVHVMKIGTIVRAILRFCFRNLRGFNVSITGGRDL